MIIFLAVQNSSIGHPVQDNRQEPTYNRHEPTDTDKEPQITGKNLQITARNQGLLLLAYKERPWRLVTFETFDQCDEEI